MLSEYHVRAVVLERQREAQAARRRAQVIAARRSKRQASEAASRSIRQLLFLVRAPDRA
jgi:hypothetical protein